MRIIVVEDEDRIRNGVVKLINKISPRYEVVAEAENGLMGLELVTLHKPDLVIVDIKMPEMDGIEMLTQLKRSGVKHKTVILSGYSDFEYAQKAIKLGVCEYLLKPITANDLEKTLTNIEKEINMEKILGTKQPQVMNSLENIFQNIVLSDNSENEELYKYLQDTYNIDSNGNFIAIDIYLGVQINNLKSKVKKTLSILLDQFNGIKYCIFELVLHCEIVVIVYNCSDPLGLERFFQNTVLKEVNGKDDSCVVIGWIGFEGVNKLKSSLHILRRELRWSIVLGEDILITYHKIQQINTKLIQYPIDIENSAKAAAGSLDSIKMRKIFEEFLSWWRKDLYQPGGVIEAFVRFASSVINIIKEINFELYEKINQKETLQRIMDSITWYELTTSFISIVEKVSSNEQKITQVLSLVMKKALNLVNEFYKNGITLDEIAAKLNITPEYLGSLFIKEIGINFSTYIKEFRIKKAKELLLGTGLKAYEIAEKVGYVDPKYFSRVFKEATGLTPGEYQKAFK